MMGNLAVALITHGRIQTTLTKAKALRPFIEKIITLAKKAEKANDSARKLHYRRLAISRVRDKAAVAKLFDERASEFTERAGGYTRIYKVGQRIGDAAEMALIELIDGNDEGYSKRPAKKAAKKATKKAAKVEEEAPVAEETEAPATEADQRLKRKHLRLKSRKHLRLKKRSQSRKQQKRQPRRPQRKLLRRLLLKKRRTHSPFPNSTTFKKPVLQRTGFFWFVEAIRLSLSSAKDRHRSGTLADQPAQCDYKRECKGVPQPAPAFLRQVEAVEVSTFDGWLREIAAEVPAKPIPFIIMLGQ